jgi:hypothetical protein
VDYNKILDNYRNFVGSIRSHTNDYDLLCDCGNLDNDGCHSDDCMTMKFRLNEEQLKRINDCTHTKCYSKGEVIDMLTELSEEFNSASYLSHEQRYKASCRVDEVIKWFKNERQ